MSCAARQNRVRSFFPGRPVPAIGTAISFEGMRGQRADSDDFPSDFESSASAAACQRATQTHEATSSKRAVRRLHEAPPRISWSSVPSISSGIVHAGGVGEPKLQRYLILQLLGFCPQIRSSEHGRRRREVDCRRRFLEALQARHVSFPEMGGRGCIDSGSLS